MGDAFFPGTKCPFGLPLGFLWGFQNQTVTFEPIPVKISKAGCKKTRVRKPIASRANQTVPSAPSDLLSTTYVVKSHQAPVPDICDKTNAPSTLDRFLGEWQGMTGQPPFWINVISHNYPCPLPSGVLSHLYRSISKSQFLRARLCTLILDKKCCGVVYYDSDILIFPPLSSK